MAKFVPKANEVEAEQFTVSSVSSKKDGVEFVDKAKLDKAGLARTTTVRDGHTVSGFAFKGKQGPEIVADGDYVVTESGGSKYAVAKDDFEALYKPASGRRVAE